MLPPEAAELYAALHCTLGKSCTHAGRCDLDLADSQGCWYVAACSTGGAHALAQLSQPFSLAVGEGVYALPLQLSHRPIT